MGNNCNSNLKNAFSKWLFAVALLLSFFTLSGFAVQKQIRSDRLQTTIVVNSNTRLVKSISYKRALVHVHRKRPAISFFALLGSAIGRLHSQQIKTFILQLSQSCKASPDSRFFYHVKTIPQSTDDAPSITLG
ncbi:MAG: hypothetical protein JWP37_1951 [Mucilaginibacter sp.]|nr:hypothetical protein [Mucilaginibacter sp.]